MSQISPIFPIHEPHHFTDYGFDPQLDYFQVLEEARKHKSAIDSFHFKLQKPISRDESNKKIKKNRKRWWWKNALLFFKRKRPSSSSAAAAVGEDYGPSYGGGRSCSGPLYITESTSGSATPYRRKTPGRPSSGPLAAAFTPSRKGDLDIPYISLRELNMDHTQRISASATAMPIYLVT